MRAARHVYEEKRDAVTACRLRSDGHQSSTAHASHELSVKLRRRAQGAKALVDHDSQASSCWRLSLLSENCVWIKKKNEQAKRELVRNHFYSPFVRYRSYCLNRRYS